MYKFGFHFSQLYFSLPRVRGKVKLSLGKVDYTENRQRYYKFYCRIINFIVVLLSFLKSKLIHRHQCYL